MSKYGADLGRAIEAAVDETDKPDVLAAITLIVNYGQIDGAHHKDWVMDQVLRHLCGSGFVTKIGVDANGKSYMYRALGKSRAYKNLIDAAKFGEDGPDTYSWDEGTPP